MSTDDALRRLQDLAELHAAGALTDDEFARAKDRLLGPVPAGPAPGEGRTAATPMAPPEVAAAAGTSQLQPRVVTVRKTAAPRSALITIAGSVLTLLAFFAMPIASLPFFGSITAASLAGQTATPGVPAALGLLWVVPLTALTVAGIGTWEAAVNGKPGKVSAIAVLGLTVLQLLVYVAVLGEASDAIRESGLGTSAMSLTGAGFWFALLGAIVAAVGGGMGIAAAGPRRTASHRPSVNPTPATVQSKEEPAREAAADLLSRPVVIGGYAMPLVVPVVGAAFAFLMFLIIVIAAV